MRSCQISAFIAGSNEYDFVNASQAGYGVNRGKWKTRPRNTGTADPKVDGVLNRKEREGRSTLRKHRKPQNVSRGRSQTKSSEAYTGRESVRSGIVEGSRERRRTTPTGIRPPTKRTIKH